MEVLRGGVCEGSKSEARRGAKGGIDRGIKKRRIGQATSNKKKKQQQLTLLPREQGRGQKKDTP